MEAVELTQRAIALGAIGHGDVVRWTGLVRDVQQPQLIAEGESFRETTAHRCHEVPHRTQWARAIAAVQSTRSTNAGMNKSSEPMENALQSMSDGEGMKESRKSKRRDEEEDDMRAVRVRETNGVKEEKKEVSLKKKEFEVVVRAYDGVQWKVNQVYEFVGTLDLNPQAMPDDMDIEWQDADNEAIKGKAQELEFIPTLHVKEVREVEFGHDVGFSTELQDVAKWASTEWEKVHGQECSVDVVREEFLKFLTATAAHGDKIVAELLLLLLLSRVYNRSDISMPFGHLSINIIWPSMKPEDATTIEQCLHLVVPTCLSLDLSLNSLHNELYFPQKDYDIEYLHSGLLQVPDGTLLIVNEANMAAGQLDDKGTHNIAALMTLVEHQALPYDFRFYKKEYNQDVKVLCLSKTKSMLPTTVHVPFQPSEQPEKTWAEPWLQCFRVYLAAYRHFVSDLGTEGAKYAEQWYVERRKEDSKVGADDLHRLVRLARLHALSQGHENVTKEDWYHIVELENQIQARIKH